VEWPEYEGLEKQGFGFIDLAHSQQVKLETFQWLEVL